jgi:hypothetical protein
VGGVGRGGGCSLFVSVIGSVDGFGSCLKT